MKALEDTSVSQIILIGDAPPHQTTDADYDARFGAKTYVEQCNILTQRGVRVFTFVVPSTYGTDATKSAFEDIANRTGGVCTILRDANDLINVVVLTVAKQVGGVKSVDEYLKKYGGTMSKDALDFGKALGQLPPPPPQK